MKDPGKEGWKLAELAERAGVSPRTVRYYVQRGLLPPPVFRGRDTAYTRAHLERLTQIRRLQEQFLPLDAIQVALEQGSASKPPPAPIRYEFPGVMPTERSAWVPMVPLPPAGPTTWERTELMPGLELHLADDAAPEVRALAERLKKWVDSEGERKR